VRWVILAAALLATGTVTAQGPPDVETLLARVSDRIEQYYRKAQQVICIERATVQPIGTDFGPSGLMRVTESELRVEPDDETGEAVTGAKLVRHIIKINGRPPSDKDKKDRSRCTDPNPLTPEPLAFLLPANREGYTFKSGGVGKGKDRGAVILEYSTVRERGDGKLVEDSRGIDDCFGFSVAAAWQKRKWIDAETFDVLRLEQRLSGPGDVGVTFAQQRKHNLPSFITVERYDTTIKYKTIAFNDPEEVMLLPESIETMSMIRNGLQSTRRRQEYTNYRRFLTAGRVVK